MKLLTSPGSSSSTVEPRRCQNQNSSHLISVQNFQRSSSLEVLEEQMQMNCSQERKIDSKNSKKNQDLRKHQNNNLKKFLTKVSSTKPPPKPLGNLSPQQQYISQNNENNLSSNPSYNVLETFQSTTNNALLSYQNLFSEPHKPSIENNLNLFSQPNEDSHITMGLGCDDISQSVSMSMCVLNVEDTTSNNLLISSCPSQNQLISFIDSQRQSNMHSILQNKPQHSKESSIIPRQYLAQVIQEQNLYDDQSAELQISQLSFQELEKQVVNQINSRNSIISQDAQNMSHFEIEKLICPGVYNEEQYQKIVDNQQVLQQVKSSKSLLNSEQKQDRKYQMIKNNKNTRSREKIDSFRGIVANKFPAQQNPVLFQSITSQRSLWSTTESFKRNELSNDRISKNQNSNMSKEYLDFVHNSKLMVQSQTSNTRQCSNQSSQSFNTQQCLFQVSNKNQSNTFGNQKRSLVYQSQVASPIRSYLRNGSQYQDQMKKNINSFREGKHPYSKSVLSQQDSKINLYQTSTKSDLEKQIYNANQLLSATLTSQQSKSNINNRLNSYDEFSSNTSHNHLQQSTERLLRVLSSNRNLGNEQHLCQSVTDFNFSSTQNLKLNQRPSVKSPLRVELQYYRPNSTINMTSLESQRSLKINHLHQKSIDENPIFKNSSIAKGNKVSNEKQSLMKSIKSNFTKQREISQVSQKENVSYRSQSNLKSSTIKQSDNTRFHKYLQNKNTLTHSLESPLQDAIRIVNQSSQLRAQLNQSSQSRVQGFKKINETSQKMNISNNKQLNSSNFQHMASKTQNLSKYLQNKALNAQSQKLNQKDGSIDRQRKFNQTIFSSNLSTEGRNDPKKFQSFISTQSNLSNSRLQSSNQTKISKRSNKENL